MTPAVNILKKKNIAYTLHRYNHDKGAQSFGLEAVQKLNLTSEQVFKTLVASLDTGELVVAIVPVTSMLNLKLLARACTSKKCAMAEKTLVEKTTGYVLGGISPLGQKKQLRTIIDSSAKPFKTIYVSAGRRGLEIEMNPLDLAQLTRGSFVSIMENNSS